MAAGELLPDALLAAARGLLARGDAATAFIWPRASAQLTRQALEDLLDDFWRERAPGLEASSRRAQLICLRSYLRPEELAGRVAHTWAALSNACHQHPYELAPTVAELDSWIAAAEALASAKK